MIKHLAVFVMTAILLLAVNSFASEISVQLSGKGVVNDSTIKAGENVSVDIYFENDTEVRGFSIGFKLTSDDIKKINHPADKGNGLNKNGDIKGFNGWEDKTIWDLGGVYVIEKDWDGALPELLGLGGLCKSKVYGPHKKAKNISFDLMVEEEGTLVLDSSFFPPTGRWLFSPPNTPPTWHGPYKFNVVK